MTMTHAIPEAWPQLLSREQLCAYLGGLSWDTVKKILPVAPLDLGANVLRYSRPEIDAWVGSLRPREPKVLKDSVPDGEDVAPAEAVTPLGDDSRVTSLDRARRRALQGPSRWAKTG